MITTGADRDARESSRSSCFSVARFPLVLFSSCAFLSAAQHSGVHNSLPVWGRGSEMACSSLQLSAASLGTQEFCYREHGWRRLTTMSLYQVFSLMSCFGWDERTPGELHTTTLLKAIEIRELEGAASTRDQCCLPLLGCCSVNMAYLLVPQQSVTRRRTEGIALTRGREQLTLHQN